MTDLLLSMMFYWCMENCAPASTPLGEIPCERCRFVIEREEESHVYVLTTEEKQENDLKSLQEPIPTKFFCSKSVVYDPSTT